MCALRFEAAAVAVTLAVLAGPAVAAPEAGDSFDAAAYMTVLAQITARRADLGARYAAARDVRARAAIRSEARHFVVETLVSQVFPAWMGMPSGGGLQATASLPPGGQIHRYGNLAADELEQRLVGLGEGLYVVGLDIHVGFIVVRGGHAWFVHSSYTPPGTVVNEPVVSSAAIALSRRKGYWVSPLFQDDRIIEMWLRRQPVPAPPQWKGVWSETGS
jgi:hypothetical protein